MSVAECLFGTDAHMRWAGGVLHDGELSKNEGLVGWKARAVSGPARGCPVCTDDGYASGRGVLQRSSARKGKHDAWGLC